MENIDCKMQCNSPKTDIYHNYISELIIHDNCKNNILFTLRSLLNIFLILRVMKDVYKYAITFYIIATPHF